MKTRIISLMIVWLSMASVVQAADGLTLSAASVKLGNEADLTVSIAQETKTYQGFQFDITLPDGLSLVADSSGKLYAFAKSQTNRPVCNVEDLGNHVYRYVVYSDAMSDFRNGEVLSLRVKAAISMTTGEYLLKMSNVILSDADGNTLKPADSNCKIRVVADIAEECIALGDAEIIAGDTKDVSLSIAQELERYTGFQFDVTLPEGFSMEAGTDGAVYALSSSQTNSPVCDVESLGSYAYRFVVYSNSSVPFKNGEVLSLHVKVKDGMTPKNYSLRLSRIALSDADGQVTKLADRASTVKVKAIAPIAITADDQTRTYGEANPVWTYTVEGGEIYGAGQPVLSCEATPKSPVGTYAITIEKGTVKNPLILTNGTLTVTKAPLTITAKSYSIKQGEPLPTTYEITYSGFKNGETKSVLSQQPSVTCAATAASEPGKYDIIVSGATADNYVISYVKGTLRIRSLVAEPGDLNDDGEVDVTDVVELIDMVLAGIYDPAGDINGDGEVDVTDVVELIDMVLSGE